ncbi:MAG: tetratricopeptide repeat protein [Bryobacteraceae bacterium]
MPIVLGGMLGVVAVFRVLSTADSAGFAIKDFTWYQYLYTQFRVFWLYIRLYLFPVSQNGDYGWTASQNIFDQNAFIGLIALLLAAAAAWRYRREFPLASFGFFGLLLLLAPTSSVVPIRDIAVERRLYLPFICLLLITVDFLRRWKISRMSLAGLLTAVSVAAAVACYQRAEIWGSALAFWSDTAQKSPGNSRAQFQLAYAQYSAGQCNEAVANYEKTAKLTTPDDRLLVDWAHALDYRTGPTKLFGEAERALAKAPSAHIYALIGMVHGKRNEAIQSLQALDKAEKLDPNFEMIYVYRGHIYLNQGQVEPAKAEYQRALNINPRNQAARNSMQVALARQEVDANRR